MHIKKYFAALLLLTFLATYGHAFPLIQDGSFENNCLLSSCQYYGDTNSGHSIGHDWNWYDAFNQVGVSALQPFYIRQNFDNQNHATSGNYYGWMDSNSNFYETELKNLQSVNGGVLHFDLNLNQFKSSGGFGKKFSIYYFYNDGRVSGKSTLSNLLSQWGNAGGNIRLGVNEVKQITVTQNDVNVTLPNAPGFIAFNARVGSGGTDSNVFIDNVTYQRLPTIVKNTVGLSQHLVANQSFQIDVNYLAGSSCTIIDTNDSTSYSTSYIGAGIYRSQSISFPNNGNNNSLSRTFTANCGGTTNSDLSWRTKINRHNLISLDGGFDRSCTDANCSYTSSQLVGTDWNFTLGVGANMFSVLRIPLDTNTTGTMERTDGQYYGVLSALNNSAGQIQTVASLNDGNVYIDINNFNGGFLTAQYRRDADNTISTLVPFLRTAGNDINIAIPPYSGKLILKMDANSGRQIIFDNIRYTNSPTTLQIGTIPAYPIPSQNITFFASYLDINSTPITGANCDLNAPDSTGFGVNTNSMSYNSSTQRYEYSQSISNAGQYTMSVVCSASNYISQSKSQTFTVFDQNPATDGMIITDIENVSHNYVFDFNIGANNFTINDVNFVPNVEASDIIFSIENPNNVSNDINISVLTDIGSRQYFIYEATQSQFDSNNWVFADTATFGSTNSNPVQRIWNDSIGKFLHTQLITIPASTKIYFKFVYKKPSEYFTHIKGEVEWINTLEPTLDTNFGLSHDKFSVSNFSNINSKFVFQVPDISGSQTQAFEMQMTAWSDVPATLAVGQVNNDINSTSNVVLGSQPHTYSFTVNAQNFNSQILILSSIIGNNPTNIHIENYSIVPRGYFTRRLELSKQNGDPLDLFLLNNLSNRYLKEGFPFKISAQAYDREGLITELDIGAFFDRTGDDINKVREQILNPTTGQETTLTFDETIDGIIDLNGTAFNPSTPRDLTIKATIKDSSGQIIAEQSQPVKFTQYPYFPQDFTINFFPTEKRKGKNPKGTLSITSNNLGALLGFDIRIYDQNTSITSPDYHNQIYKGIDFDCPTNTCNLQLTIPDYIFEDANVVHFVVTALLNTENFNLTNPLTQVDRVIFISGISFDTEKIHQVVQRLDETYRNDEEIPLVLILRDSEASNIKNKVNVYLTLQNCNDAGGTICTNQTTQYQSTGFIYDDMFNYNYFFFRHLFLLDNGQLLPDGNYIGFHANISDATGITSSSTAVLADKCKNADYGATFWLGSLVSILSSLLNLNECNTAQEAIVTTSVNNDQEKRIHINASKSTTAPTQEAFACVAPDTNNVIGKPLEQDFLCASWYEVGEQPIDDLRTRITNNFSDVSNTSSTKQYVEFNLPYELVAYNDLGLLEAELKTDQDSSINTTMDFLFEGFRRISRDTVIKALQDRANFVLGQGLIPNVGADINFNQAFSPAFVGGFVFYKIHGIPTINAQDFKNDSKVKPVFSQLDRTQFLEYLSNHGVNFKGNDASVDVYVNSFDNPIRLTDTSGHLVIDEKPSQQVNTQNVSGNQSAPYHYIPSLLLFNFSHTMFFNNFSGNSTLSVPIHVLSLFFTSVINGIIDFFGGAASGGGQTDVVGSIGNAVTTNALWIAIVLVLIYMVAVIRSRLKN